ncbi:MAG: hypothetical protein AB7N65_21010 [Vicinamibacterales bacterium]
MTFMLDGYTVVASPATEYREGSCPHLESGRRIDVRGVAIGMKVDAERVTIRGRD